jgi:hypothetical protein
LQGQFDKSAEIMACLGQAFAKLHSLSSDFNVNCEYGKNDVQERIYFSLQNCFNHWSEKTVRVVNSMEENFIGWMDYNKSELEAVKEVRFLGLNGISADQRP